jgi:hypothetical protein
MVLTISILSALLIVASFIIWNLLRKNEKGEDIIVYQEGYIKKFSEAIDFCNKEIRKIDEKGTFKSDDEIGFFFNKIKQIQELLNQFNAKN